MQRQPPCRRVGGEQRRRDGVGVKCYGGDRASRGAGEQQPVYVLMQPAWHRGIHPPRCASRRSLLSAPVGWWLSPRVQC